MKVLLIPTTEGLGHVSRAKAIIEVLKRDGIEYSILTDKKRAEFLKNNGIDSSRIDSSFYGLSYIYTKGGNERSLNLPLTTCKLCLDSPRYIADYLKVLGYILPGGEKDEEGYALLINDFNLQLTRMPWIKVINITHYNLPCNYNDAKRMFSDPRSFFYEGFIEPIINTPLIYAERFQMDLRKAHIDYEHIFSPIVSKITKDEREVRKELHLKMNDKLIVDGRKNPPLSTYKELSSEYPDLNFLVRAEEEVEVNENIRLKIFIPDLINYIAAADLFITNPGFASLSEGAICKTPMLIDLPTNHFEEIKNLKIAEEEGYGKRINYLKNDILAGVEGEIAKDCSNLKNGLPYLIEKIKEVEED